MDEHIQTHSVTFSAVSPMSVEKRLKELGLNIASPTIPAWNYVPFVRTGNLVHIAGQIPKVGDEVKFVGKLGEKFTVEQGQEAARICITNFLAATKAAAGGNLDNVQRFVKINVFVNGTPTFTQQPLVANGASDFIVKIFGEAGKHARSAVGVAQLPMGVAVEIDGVVELKASSKL
jgi:enamine deaminase RidA (YjgF/YER057c/UK114 family)